MEPIDELGFQSTTGGYGTRPVYSSCFLKAIPYRNYQLPDCKVTGSAYYDLNNLKTYTKRL